MAEVHPKTSKKKLLHLIRYANNRPNRPNLYRRIQYLLQCSVVLDLILMMEKPSDLQCPLFTVFSQKSQVENTKPAKHCKLHDITHRVITLYIALFWTAWDSRHPMVFWFFAQVSKVSSPGDLGKCHIQKSRQGQQTFNSYQSTILSEHHSTLTQHQSVNDYWFTTSRDPCKGNSIENPRTVTPSSSTTP